MKCSIKALCLICLAKAWTNHPKTILLPQNQQTNAERESGDGQALGGIGPSQMGSGN
jgi:hypothetical protein